VTTTPDHSRAAVPPRGGGAFLCLLKPLSLLASLTLHAAADVPWSFDPSLLPSTIRNAASGPVLIRGTAPSSASSCTVSVTLSTTGASFSAPATITDGSFSLRYPDNFPGAPPLAPSLLYLDVLSNPANPPDAEALLVIHGTKPPDLPLPFSDDAIDASDHRDHNAAQFPLHRALVNHFLHSRAASLMGIRRPDFDLAKPDDLTWFRNHAALYDFDHRDRDWSSPLGHRPARGFWQAVWNRWFNASNNHPWDGNPQNRSPDNFRPYTFTNDAADLAVLYAMLRRASPAAPDHRDGLLREVMENLLALQHRSPDNFPLPDASGHREHYSAGAFRYGMFESGEWLTEGTGWFANPRFRDFAHGGVFNGRAVWALGEVLAADPQSPLAPRLRDALALTLRFCLHDGLAHHYTSLTPSGLPLWNYPGEHGYLLLGLTAACRSFPDFPVALNPAHPPRPLRDITADALDALAESAAPDGSWTDYANVNAVNIAALASGTLGFPSHPRAPAWRDATRKATTLWLSLSSQPDDAAVFGPLFGDRRGNSMTFRHGNAPAHADLYVSGHWLHALALAHRAAALPAALDRANALAASLCGHNALHVRLLTEIGAINNRITAPASPGLPPRLAWDAYPESTAFFQIGLLHLLP
jgi:hypothetical protein